MAFQEAWRVPRGGRGRGAVGRARRAGDVARREGGRVEDVPGRGGPRMGSVWDTFCTLLASGEIYCVPWSMAPSSSLPLPIPRLRREVGTLRLWRADGDVIPRLELTINDIEITPDRITTVLKAWTLTFR